MRLRQRAPYIAVLAAASVAEVGSGVVRMVGGEAWWAVGAPIALGVPLGVAAVLLYLHKPSEAVPYWARSMEVLRTGKGMVVRCVDCDEMPIVSVGGRLSAIRVLTYAHLHHTSGDCTRIQREQAAARREAAERIADRGAGS